MTVASVISPRNTADRRADDDAALSAERDALESLYARWHHPHYIDPDPLAVVRRYERLEDREIIGLVAACLAYGNVTAMLAAIERVIEPLGPNPAQTLGDWTSRQLARRYAGFRYRFTDARQLTALLRGAVALQRKHGSLEPVIIGALQPGDATTCHGLDALVDAIRASTRISLAHLLPRPADGSACKRLNLYLRWMVREDAVDPGGWTSISPRLLVMPLDVHVGRAARERRWTARRTAGRAMALEITDRLRRIQPDDPLRYDFALTRPGIRRVRADEGAS